MFQAHRSSFRPPLHTLIQLRYLTIVIPILPLKNLHLFLDEPLRYPRLMKLVLIDKDLIGIVIGSIACHLEALTLCCGGTLDSGYELAYVLFHLNS